jgi:hypothetical protein
VTHRASSAAAQRARPMGRRRDEQGLWGDGVTRRFNGAAARRVGPVGRWRAGPATAAACRSSGAACRSCRQGRRIVLFLVLQLTCAPLLFPSSRKGWI